MRRIHINENQLLEIANVNYPQAGTDFPHFYDEETDTWYEASWNDDYGFPFGFWSDDYYGNNQIFSVGEAWTTHINACGKVAERYFIDAIYEQVNEDVDMITDKASEIYNDINNYGYTYDEESDVYVSEDGDEINLYNVADDLAYDLKSFSDMVKVYNILVNVISNDGNIDEQTLTDEILEAVSSEQDFTTQEGINNALELIGDNWQNFFERGCNEGRIWPRLEMIGFYETEQPDPERLLYILKLLSQNEEIGVSYEELLNYHMIFEDWRNDGGITCCTISDYVDGNYGLESYDDEEEVQYARQGKTQFVPHLANQDEKRAFFKDFRDTRDREVYVPRERGAGNLARYHALRYPYGENKKINYNKIIK